MSTTTTFILISVFALVYICIVYALGQSEFRDARFVLAFPVSILCVLGFLRGGGNTQKKFTLDLVLIPYEALAYALIVIVLLWILSRFHLRIRKTLKRRDRPKSESEDIGQEYRTMANQEKILKENRDETYL